MAVFVCRNDVVLVGLFFFLLKKTTTVLRRRAEPKGKTFCAQAAPLPPEYREFDELIKTCQTVVCAGEWKLVIGREANRYGAAINALTAFDG